MGAFLAGMPLVFPGGFLVYKSFGINAARWFLSKIGIVLVLVGLGLMLYRFSGPVKNP